MLLRLSAFPVLAVIVAGFAQADAVHYSATLDTNTHWYQDFNQISVNRLEPSVWPTLTGDFSSSKQLIITYSAPAGQQFNVGPPMPGATISIFQVGLAMNGSGPLIGTVPGTFSFAGLSGPAPWPLDVNWYGRADGLDALANWSWTTAFSFRSITLVFDLPAAYTAAFNNATLSDVSMYVDIEFPPEYTGGDPGSAASISAVPEPSTIVLTTTLVFGLALGGYARRLGRQ
jgi:hypothetical protein